MLEIDKRRYLAKKGTLIRIAPPKERGKDHSSSRHYRRGSSS